MFKPVSRVARILTQIIACLLLLPHVGWSQTEQGNTTEEPVASATMTAEKLDEMVRIIDSEAVREGSQWQFVFGEITLIMVIDVNADRMRLITPIEAVDPDDEHLLMRLMQANFDAALDARYAVAQEIIWGTFIHPLSSLTERDFASAVFQTANLATSYGSTYSSGLFTFGGGDSQEEYRKLLQKLQQNDPSST